MLVITESVIWHETDGNVSLYDIKAGKFQTLNETGSKIWMLISGEEDRKLVFAKLVKEFAGDNASLAAAVLTDTKAFITSAIEYGWIEENSK